MWRRLSQLDFHVLAQTQSKRKHSSFSITIMTDRFCRVPSAHVECRNVGARHSKTQSLRAEKTVPCSLGLIVLRAWGPVAPSPRGDATQRNVCATRLPSDQKKS